MAAPFNIDAYSDALVVLATAGIVVPLVQRFGISPVLGYLAAGAMLGPLGLGSFVGEFPLLRWLSVFDARNVAGIADLGIVFLLFLIGLELSWARLVAMRRLVLGLGGLQVTLTTAAIAALLSVLGHKPAIAVVVAACLSLSSTAIVLESLSNQGRLATSAGRASFSVLLAQDLAVVPLLIFISILGAGPGGSVLASLGTALLQAALSLLTIIVLGRFLLRPLFRLVAGTRSSDLMMAAILFVIVASGVAAGLAGLSMALGAFVAGLLLAETEYRKVIEATIDPFKGLLLGIFFFTVGMSIDVRELLREPVWLLAAVAALIAFKAVIVYALSRWFQVAWLAALETALLLGPAGEFAFVGLELARTTGVMDRATSSFFLAVTSLGMAMIPVLAILARQLGRKLARPREADTALLARPDQNEPHAIVVGYGRVGRVVGSLLEHHKVPYVATESDPVTVARERAAGHSVYYGSASDPAFLRACGIDRATGVIITIHAQDVIDGVVARIRELRPDVPIVSRARDAAHARHLYAVGATDAVPETIEASLQLSEAALVGLGVPTGPVIASIHEKREEFRSDLQQAAQAAGRDESRSLRPSTRSA